MKTLDIDKRKSYINFSLGNENFAIIVDKVLEIFNLVQLTHVPNASEFVKGILSFRGAIVPIINLHKRFNFAQPDVESNMVVVVEVLDNDNHVLMGLLVDKVTDVIEFEYKDIRAVPETGIIYNPEFLEGFIQKNKKFTMVLDVDRVLNVAELARVSEGLTTQTSV
jgi:purine-binding chemotaxis protein CheW